MTIISMVIIIQITAINPRGALMSEGMLYFSQSNCAMLISFSTAPIGEIPLKLYISKYFNPLSENTIINSPIDTKSEIHNAAQHKSTFLVWLDIE